MWFLFLVTQRTKSWLINFCLLLYLVPIIELISLKYWLNFYFCVQLLLCVSCHSISLPFDIEHLRVGSNLSVSNFVFCHRVGRIHNSILSKIPDQDESLFFCSANKQFIAFKCGCQIWRYHHVIWFVKQQIMQVRIKNKKKLDSSDEISKTIIWSRSLFYQQDR